ncbi:MAG: site-specific DNA-methyltransferase [Actinomycetota bacterium]|nr:site-specific DNA-methyltransferase [Actinomycetota bacterium]
MTEPYFTDSSGRVMIYCGDAREILGELRADAIVSDPPHGSMPTGAHSRSISEWDRLPEQQDLDLCRAATDGPVVWFGAARPDCLHALLALQPLASRVYVWHRGFSYSRSDGTFWQWQPILAWGVLKDMGRDVLTAHRVDDCGRVHPAQKPEGLMRLLVEAACPVGGTVLDPWMGSGTTLRAAKDLGRKAIGIEIREAACEVAARRLGQEVLAFP